MNYKINQLNNPIECSQIKFPNIEALKYGKVAEGKADTITVFNATSFSVSIGINIDVSTFMRTQKNYIDRLIQENIVKADKLFFVDKDNNVYISTGLEIIFLMFASKDYQIYFFELLEDILTNGMAFSDGLILKMAMERIPNDTLQEIVYHRNEQKNNKRGERFRQPTKVLAFNNQLKLAAVFASYNMAERLTGIPHQMLVRACKGEIIAIKKHYWRELEEDETISTVFESEDFGTYSLLEYDREIGINREIYYNQKMEKGKIIPESEYENRSQYIKTFEYQKWKRERTKNKYKNEE